MIAQQGDFVDAVEGGLGAIFAADVKMLDFTGVDGTWVNCFGSVPPWNTPLSAEELYFDDTVEWINPESEDKADPAAMQAYLGKPANPYDYGYIVEITDPAGAATSVRHFALGRFSHENAYVMPDQKTVYMSGDRGRAELSLWPRRDGNTARQCPRQY